MSEIKPIGVPQTVIDDIPSPNVNTIPPPVINNSPPPVVDGIRPPVVDVPGATIDYPIIDVPTEESFEGDLSQPQVIPQETQEESDRELPPSNPTLDVGGLEIPLPKPEVAVTSATTAAVTTVAALFSAMLVQQMKTALTPLAKQIVAEKKGKKKKKKKAKKPVLHFVENEGVVEIFQYTEKGVKVIDKVEGNLETYLRDQIEINPYYEQESKIIIDDVLKDRFTKEGAKRFKDLFAPAKVILKKLSARLSF